MELPAGGARGYVRCAREEGPAALGAPPRQRQEMRRGGGALLVFSSEEKKDKTRTRLNG